MNVSIDDDKRCQICGEPMPKGEEMFNYHGYRGPCPKPSLVKAALGSAAPSEITAEKFYDSGQTEFNFFPEENRCHAMIMRFGDALLAYDRAARAAAPQAQDSANCMSPSEPIGAEVVLASSSSAPLLKMLEPFLNHMKGCSFYRSSSEKSCSCGFKDVMEAARAAAVPAPANELLERVKDKMANMGWACNIRTDLRECYAEVCKALRDSGATPKEG